VCAFAPDVVMHQLTDLEAMTLSVDSVVIRYGQLYGPNTFYEAERPSRCALRR